MAGAVTIAPVGAGALRKASGQSQRGSSKESAWAAISSIVVDDRARWLHYLFHAANASSGDTPTRAGEDSYDVQVMRRRTRRLLACVPVIFGFAACGNYDSDDPDSDHNPTPATDAGRTEDHAASPPFDAGIARIVEAAVAPDALATATVLTFGERTGAMIAHVTTDTQLSNSPTTITFNWGHAPQIVADNDPVKVALMRIDLSAIPTARQVTSAKLSVWTNDCTNCGGGATSKVSVWRVLETWEEGAGDGSAAGAANWNQRTKSDNWLSPGAGPMSRESPAAATFAPTTLSTPYEIDITKMVQTWVATPSANYGFLFLVEAGDAIGLVSAENPAADHRPLLTVNLAP